MNEGELKAVAELDAPARKATVMSARGGEVKALPGGRIGGLILRFGTTDVQGDVFSADGDYGLDDLKSCRLLYHHGLRRYGKKRIGTLNKFRKTRDGIEAEGEIDLSTPEGREIFAEAKAGKLGFSSGSTHRIVTREPRPDGSHLIVAWPIVEVSVSPQPVDPSLRVEVKSRPASVNPTAQRIKVLNRLAKSKSNSENTMSTGEVMQNNQGSKYKSFESFGEFLWAAAQRRPASRARWERYENECKASGLNLANDSEGGVLSPPDVSEDVFQAALALEEYPSSYFQRRTTAGNSFLQRKVVDVSRVDGSRGGGLQFQIVAEGMPNTPQKPLLMDKDVRLSKLVADIRITSDLVEDAPGLTAYLDNLVAQELAIALSEACIYGFDGSPAPGLINHPATITVAKDGSQTATTITKTNLQNMLNRLDPRSVPNAKWYYSPTARAQLANLGHDVVTYANPGVANACPFTIYGHDAWPLEICQTLGTRGDIWLMDASQIQLVTRTVGLEKKVSAHVYFNTAEELIRFVIRFSVLPIPHSPVIPFAGSDTLSPFVTLADRA